MYCYIVKPFPETEKSEVLASCNPLVAGKNFWEFFTQIYRTVVFYDQTDRVKWIFHDCKSQIFWQKTAHPCRNVWFLGHRVPEH